MLCFLANFSHFSLTRLPLQYVVLTEEEASATIVLENKEKLPFTTLVGAVGMSGKLHHTLALLLSHQLTLHPILCRS